MGNFISTATLVLFYVLQINSETRHSITLDNPIFSRIIIRHMISAQFFEVLLTNKYESTMDQEL